MVGTRRGLGFVSRSVALGGLRGILSGAVPPAGHGQGLGEGLYPILGPAEKAHPREEPIWDCSQRRRPAVARPAPGFTPHRRRLSERYVSKRGLCRLHVALDDVWP